MNPDIIERVYQLVAKDCKESGVKFIFGPGNTVPYAGEGIAEVSGYFEDEPKPVLAAAGGAPLYILIHEYCHMQQWKEAALCWLRLGDACDIIDKWISGIDFPEDVLTESFDRVIDVELDCEMRTADFIKQHDIPIDIEEYTQKSNAYILFYNKIRETRKWYTPDTKPYMLESVWSKMPTTFNIERYSLTPEQEVAFSIYS